MVWEPCLPAWIALAHPFHPEEHGVAAEKGMGTARALSWLHVLRASNSLPGSHGAKGRKTIPGPQGQVEECVEPGRLQPFSRKLFKIFFRVSLCSPAGLIVLCTPGWLTTFFLLSL